MKIISSLRKRTKSGISVWHFCHDEEMNHFYAVGGEHMQIKPARSRQHLKEMHTNFRRYGYQFKLPSKKMLVADPWESQLPLDMQHELAALA